MRDQEIIGLQEAYASIYSTISESHFKVGDEVICKNSGMEGEVVKVDPEEKGKYYTVKREDGKTVKYAPDELKLEKEEDEKEDMKEAKNGGVDKKTETKFHKKLDTLVHKTFGEREEEKKMKEDIDIFDVILEHLVAEGFADTNEAALVIMANMSEGWKQSIVEAYGSFGANMAGAELQRRLEQKVRADERKKIEQEKNGGSGASSQVKGA